MLEASLQYPRFQQDLGMLTRFDNDFRYTYLMQLKPDQFRAEIKTDVLANPRMDNFSEAQRRDLLEKWALKGDPDSLIAQLDAHPDLVPDEWFYRSLAEAAEGEYAQAVEGFAPHLTPPRIARPRQYLGTTLEENQRIFSNTPDDVVRGMILLDMQVKAGDYYAALRTANVMAERKQVPPALYYWKGEIHRKLGQSKDAWDAWYRYSKLGGLQPPADEDEADAAESGEASAGGGKASATAGQ
jgi:tetratricopeptide (TPR) repeat protein